MLRRTADDTDPVERVLVANADQLVIVTAVADPMPRTGFIDRCLVAAYTGDLAPLLCLTKADLADPGPFAARTPSWSCRCWSPAATSRSGWGRWPTRSPDGCRCWSGTPASASRRW